MRLTSFILFLCLLTPCLYGQRRLSTGMLGVKSQPLVTVSDTMQIKALLRRGAYAFLLNPEGLSDQALIGFLSVLKKNYEAVERHSLILVNPSYDATIWNNALNEVFGDEWMEKQGSWQDSALFYTDLQTNKVISLNLDGGQSKGAKSEVINYKPGNELDNQELLHDFLMAEPAVCVPDSLPHISFYNWVNRQAADLRDDLHCLLSIWLKTGKRPHFIKCAPDSFDRSRRLAEILSTMPFHSACFRKQNKEYAPVFSSELNAFQSGGRVSFPAPPGYIVELTPQTYGHRFSPDVFIFTEDYKWQEVLFRVFPLARSEAQVMHFHFDDEEAPSEPAQPDLYFSADSFLVQDEQRGDVYHFDGHKAYLDCGSTLGIDFEKPITIAAWIKPEQIDQDHSLIGMGRSFSFKIQREMVTFTTAGIRDHRLSEVKVKPGEWQHVAVVFEPLKRIKLYLNGEMLWEDQASGIQESEYNIVVGTNIWGEYFSGSMDDLIIWNRALADDEVHFLMHSEVPGQSKGSLFIPVIVIVLLVGALALWMIRKGRQAKTAEDPYYSRSTKEEREKVREMMDRQPLDKLRIKTFGGFSLIDDEGHDVAKHFSPKEKQLFIYLLWHTVRSGGKGVSSRQLSEDLWPGMAAHKAKNNRSTYMQRLRQHVSKTSVQIIYSQNKMWQLQLPDEMTCDLKLYTHLMTQLKKEVSIDKLNALMPLLSNGPFLKETQAEVVDHFKGEVENEVIQLLTLKTVMALTSKVEGLTGTVIKVVRQYDPLNEPMLALELQWLTGQGHHGRALDAYERFCREYQLMYGEAFNKVMGEVMCSE